MAICWLDGKLMDASEAKVSVFDHGLLYGDGIFEGIRFYQKVPFRVLEHLQRLEMSARAILLSIPYDQSALQSAIKETIDASGQTDGYIRLVVTRGAGKLGINPKSCAQGSVFIIVDQLEMVNQVILEEGARVMIASTRRLKPDGLDPKIKSLNYLNHIMAKVEANQAGFDEAIMLNHMGCVAEGTVDNVFIVARGVLKTPPISDGALDGITRQVVIEIAKEQNISVVEKSLTTYDLYTADECFLTGTGAELIPVREIMGRFLASSSRPVFNKLQTAFFEFVAKESGTSSSVKVA